MEYNIIEKFLSIDGEGPTAGELAVFIRFGGCNLSCRWCDTAYSIPGNAKGEMLTKEQIYEFIKSCEVENVTVTGGEPLIHDGIEDLICFLALDNSLRIHIETNGSVPVYSFEKLASFGNVSFIIDYKLPGSGMENKMCLENFELIRSNDVCKFVISSSEDLERAAEIINKFSLTSKCLVYLSPVISETDPKIIVEFMKNHKMNRVRLQLQLHKIIWSPDTRGV